MSNDKVLPEGILPRDEVERMHEVIHGSAVFADDEAMRDRCPACLAKWHEPVLHELRHTDDCAYLRSLDYWDAQDIADEVMG